MMLSTLVYAIYMIDDGAVEILRMTCLKQLVLTFIQEQQNTHQQKVDSMDV